MSHGVPEGVLRGHEGAEPVTWLSQGLRMARMTSRDLANDVSRPSFSRVTWRPGGGSEGSRGSRASHMAQRGLAGRCHGRDDVPDRVLRGPEGAEPVTWLSRGLGTAMTTARTMGGDQEKLVGSYLAISLSRGFPLWTPSGRRTYVRVSRRSKRKTRVVTGHEVAAGGVTWRPGTVRGVVTPRPGCHMASRRGF